MRIEVTGKSMDVTDAIRQYAEQKAEKLPRYYDGVQEIEVVLDQQKSDFQAEFRVDGEKHDTFVSRDAGDDIYRCIDVATDKMTRQLKDFKEKLKESRR